MRNTAIALLWLTLASLAQAAPPAGVTITDVAPATTWTLAVGPETLRTEQARGDVWLRWRRHRLPAERWALASPGADLDGDGAREQVLAAWEGRRCRVWVLDHGRLRRLPGWHAEGARLVDLDRDGVAELVTRDETFRGWRGACEADGVCVEIVLERTRRGQLWRLAPALRGIARPDPQRLHERGRLLGRAWRVSRTLAARSSRHAATAAAASLPAPRPREAERALTSALLELYAAGHGSLAEALLAAAWPPERPGRAAFWAAFQERLAESPYLAR